ncbi:MAG: carbamoyl phosphate synthase large subunit, partial [bacterium]|nr:carbamoyl phosphate synthase large subunit [bacterium]
STGYPFAEIGCRIILGKKIREVIDEYDIKEEKIYKPKYVTVKEVVLPFSKFEDVDVVLKPQMRSTGEVMGIDKSFELAYIKSQIAAGAKVKKRSCVLSIAKNDKEKSIVIAKKLKALGYKIYATEGSYIFLKENGVETELMDFKGIIELIRTKGVGVVINTPSGDGYSYTNGYRIRRIALNMGIPIITTIEAANVFVEGLIKLNKNNFEIRDLKSWYKL